MASKIQSDLAAFEQGVVAAAAAWTAFVRIGPHEKYREDHKIAGAAIASGLRLAARHQRDALIYATDENGRDVMVGKVDRRDGSFVSAIPGVTLQTLCPDAFPA